MKEEEPLSSEEILQVALPSIDGSDFHDCGTEFKKELRWGLVYFFILVSIEKTYQTREIVFDHISKHLETLEFRIVVKHFLWCFIYYLKSGHIREIWVTKLRTRATGPSKIDCCLQQH